MISADPIRMKQRSPVKPSFHQDKVNHCKIFWIWTVPNASRLEITLQHIAIVKSVVVAYWANSIKENHKGYDLSHHI